MSLGGSIVTGQPIERFEDLPAAQSYLFNTSPASMVKICGDRLPEAERRQLTRKLEPVAVQAGTLVVREGVPAKAAFIVKRGAFRVTFRASDREVAVALLRPHEVLGDLAEGLDVPQAESITAVTDSEVLRLAPEDLAALRSRSAPFSAALDALRLERAERCVAALRAARDDLEVRVRVRTAELANANDELQQERDLLHTMMDNLPHSIYFKDESSHFIRINRALARLFGIADPSQAVGRTDADFFSRDHAAEALADEQEIMRTGRPVIDKEEKETWPDGHVTWALSTKMPLRDAGGRIAGTFGVSRDITEQRQAEVAMRASEMRYRTLYDSSRDAIMVLDPERGFLAGNPASVQLFGCRDEQQFTSCTPVDLSPEQQPDGALSLLKARQMIDIAMERGSHFFEWRHRRIDGAPGAPASEPTTTLAR